MQPLLDSPVGSGWQSFDVAGIIVEDATVYISMAKTNLVGSSAPWGLVEAFDETNGTPLWRTYMDEPIGAPVIANGRFYTLANASVSQESKNSGSLRDSADVLLSLDLSNGAVVSRMPSGLHGSGTLVKGSEAIFLAGAQWDDAEKGTIQVSRFNPATGRFEWSTHIHGYLVSSVLHLPNQVSEQVLIEVAGMGYTSLRATDGTIAWSLPGVPTGAVASGDLAFLTFQQAWKQMLTAVYPLAGTPVWSVSRPWQDLQGCPPLLVQDHVVLFGSQDKDSTANKTYASRLVSYRAWDGKEEWHSWQRAGGIYGYYECRFATAGDGAIFINVEHPDHIIEAEAVRASDGKELWEAPYSIYPVVEHAGTLLGRGSVPLFRRLPLDRNEYQSGLIALDAGAGSVEPPHSAFVGPDSLHEFDLATFEDRSMPGARPIVARYWSFNGVGETGHPLEDGRDPEFQLGGIGYTGISRAVVTLTVMDDQYHVAEVNRTYDLLPPIPPHEAGSASLAGATVLILVVMGLAVRRLGFPKTSAHR